MFSYTLQFSVQMTEFQIKKNKKKKKKNKTSAKPPGVRVGDRVHSESLCNILTEKQSGNCLVTKTPLHLKVKII